MKLFETIREMGHEQVLFCHDQDANFKAIIAIHDSSLGRAMGGTRLWPYESEEAALRDVLNLSHAMTYKAACANIPVGGGKAVIMANPENKTDELLESYGRFIESLKGRFITGQDVNISPQDVQVMHRETNYLAGLSEQAGGPAETTAIGVLVGIKAAAEFHLGRKKLEGLKVAVQGVGNVGKILCRYLHEHEVKLFVSDISSERTEEIRKNYGATVVDSQEIYSLDVDVFAPCALGGILKTSTISQLQAPIIAGSANNQLKDEELHSQFLESKGILYCPDYVINAGGLINVYNEMIGVGEDETLRQVHSIYNTLFEIFHKAQQERVTTQEASKRLAKERIQQARALSQVAA